MQQLSSEKMSSLSKNWVVDRRAELLGVPQTAGIMPDLDAAHKGLQLVIEHPPAPNGEIEVINRILKKKDSRHDALLRLGYYHLGAQLAWALADEDDVAAEEISSLRKRLYPHDLGGTTLGYDEQEGAAILVEGNLEPAKKRLEEIRLQRNGRESTLLEVVIEQISLAKEVMTLVRQRDALLAKAKESMAPADERKARHAWMEAVRALVSNLRLAVRRGAIKQSSADSLLRELREAEEEERLERKKRKEEAAKGAP